MDLVYLPTPDTAATGPIRQRSRDSSRGSLTRHYACRENGQEVALLSLDIDPQHKWPDQDTLVIYELFVPGPLRNHGIGTRALMAAEDFARVNGFHKTLLTVRPLFGHRTQQAMNDWYQRRGYTLVQNASAAFTMEKVV